jgi:hypothetical protein
MAKTLGVPVVPDGRSHGGRVEKAQELGGSVTWANPVWMIATFPTYASAILFADWCQWSQIRGYYNGSDGQTLAGSTSFYVALHYCG